MKFAIKTSIGLVCLLVLVNGSDTGKSNINFNDQCQALKCNPTKEICRLNPECDEQKSICVYCARRDDQNSKPVSKTLLASSLSQQQAPLAPRLLAKSNGNHLLASNHDQINPSEENKLNNETSYDDYYEYDEDETSDKEDFGEEDDYLDDYVESVDPFIKETNTIRKFGVCPKVLATNEKCDPSKIIQSECRFDTDCSGEQKCCESTCGKRVCNLPTKTSVSVCPSSFTCTLNCRLGYQTDANGCLLCECQSCPSMDHCQKNCPSGYLKDLFGCDICECSDRCPTFSCSIMCPPDVGFAKSSDGCPLCQCETTKTKPVEYTSTCQDDVHCPPGFRCLNDARNVPMCQAVSESIKPVDKCPQDFASTCSLQCTNNKYAVDENGCPICACASQSTTKVCPLLKCQNNCGELGYKSDSNGCRTCECAAKSSKIECSRVMCRMFCAHGFRRDENGCEICACNSSPQPCPKLRCNNICLNGYRKDYNGCQTCICNDEIVDDLCPPMKCSLDCKYGFERDASGCSLCSCSKCPIHTCRQFCMYGFKKNNDGCDICECDWSPIAEKISCSERIPCEDNRVCNLNLKYCELVSPEKVNWFVYNFDIKSNLFTDPQFVKTFKKDLINNIAAKYDLETTQITVSSVEDNGETSFQVMPFFIESMDDFQQKMDKIDIDLNSHEFRSVLPSVARQIEKTTSKPTSSFWTRYIQPHSTLALYIVAVCIGIVALFFATIFLLMVRYRLKHPGRSESKSPIYDTSYHQAPTEDDQYHAVHAPDGTAYVVVESDDMHSSNDRRALV